ncbi:hypothetical protein L6164_001171 [Bauhinia variegata]|uniref:Uncharacterized protein n=1 Tax=Bauhinia variegata TaxID=167791 RepID=A0ACB9Q886_BAUVA|nr:hypothetical protein L6164_001171 [Bauhinia variegata]
MGAVLLQNGHPISYHSKKLCPRLLQASTYVCELHAITSAVKKWQTYLLGNRFTIHTDQCSLKELMSQVIQTPEQQYYLSKLLGYCYYIVYKPGTTNPVADALSRVHEVTSHMMAITIPQFVFLDRLKYEYSSNPILAQKMQVVQQQPDHYLDYKILNGILYRNGKIYLDGESNLKALLIEEFHGTPLGGHGVDNDLQTREEILNKLRCKLQKAQEVMKHYANQHRLPHAFQDVQHEHDPQMTKVLVQWDGLAPEDSTWESLTEILQAYPNLHLEDKVFLQHQANDRDELNDSENEVGLTNDFIPAPQTRAKRNRIKPKWLRDYEVA